MLVLNTFFQKKLLELFREINDSKDKSEKTQKELRASLPESKEVLKNKETGDVKGTKELIWKASQWPKLEQFKQQNNQSSIRF